MIEQFKERLTMELQNGLPGQTAHKMMMPTARDDRMVFPQFENDPVRSAVLLLFYPDREGRIKFPLIQRPVYNGAHSAQVSFPGGKAEETDRDIVHTALREAEEEIGIDVSKIEVTGRLTDLFISVSNFLVTPVIGFMENRQTFTPEPSEVAHVIEAELYDIVDPDKRKEGKIVVREKYHIQTPYFDIGNRIVWGATAMMLSELSELLKKTRIF